MSFQFTSDGKKLPPSDFPMPLEQLRNGMVEILSDSIKAPRATHEATVDDMLQEKDGDTFHIIRATRVIHSFFISLELINSL